MAMLSRELFDGATITSDDEVALSEGFCPRCLSRLRLPVYGSDGSNPAVVVSATQCGNDSCGVSYFR